MTESARSGSDAAAAAEAQELWTQWFESSPIGMTLARPTDGTYLVNRAFAEMLGRGVEELRGAESELRFTHPDDRELDRRNVERLIAGEQEMARWDKRYIHADGHIVWGRASGFLMRNEDGSPRLLVTQIEDRTANRELEQRLASAEHDSLTGLLTRGCFERAAGEQIARCRRYGERAALLMLDLDQLKLINDSYGHLVGDAALKAVGGAVSGRLRASDIAYRYGGDEFVVLMPHTSVVDAEKVALAIERSIERSGLTAVAGAVSLTASVGIAPIDANTPDVRTALREADAAMYVVKRRRGSGRVSAAGA